MSHQPPRQVNGVLMPHGASGVHSSQANYRELFDLIHGKHSQLLYWFQPPAVVPTAP